MENSLYERAHGSRETACGSHGLPVVLARTREADLGVGFRGVMADGLDVTDQAKTRARDAPNQADWGVLGKKGVYPEGCRRNTVFSCSAL